MSEEQAQASLHICALGAPVILRDGVIITNQLSRAAQLLLVYLLTTNQAQSRESLAELFWPEREPQLAGSNLRTVLTEMRKSCGAYLAISRASVAVNSAHVRYDVHDFGEQLAAAKAALAQNAIDAAITHWEAALRLHRAPFLATLREPESSELQLWLAFERELLHKQMLGALRQLVIYYSEQRQLDRALALAQRWLTFEPLDEEALHQVMWIYGQRNEPESALAHYQRFRHLYRQEQGIAPNNPRLDALAATLTAAIGRPLLIKAPPNGGDEPLPVAPEQPHVAPPPPRFAPPAPLVNLYGRSEQIKRICDLLHAPTMRLVSLMGMGGVGKSLLAQAVGVQLAGELSSGVCFVPLADVRAAADATSQQQQVALAITAALGIKPTEEALVYSTLQRSLRDLELLLILDNCEHVAAALGWITDLLQAAPRLRILATTRVRLNLLAETVELVPSLRLPQEASLAQLCENPCIQLFVERAQQLFPAFTLDATNALALQRICHAVGGLPLALELAAHWTLLFTPAEIATTLAQEFDLLTTDYRDVPERQRSMATVFAHTWQLLPPPAQRTLAALSIFQNSFTRSAALAVAACPLPTLMLLVNHALVEVHTAGVYALHPLVKSFAAPHRQADKGVEARYITYFLTEWLSALRMDQAGAPTVGLRDLPIRQQADLAYAWEAAIAGRWYEQLAQAVANFTYFWRLIGRPREALHLLGLLQQHLQTFPTLAGAQQALLGRTLYQKMWIAYRLLADFTAAGQDGEDAYRLLAPVGTVDEVGDTLVELGSVYLHMGRATAAVAILQQALTFATAKANLRLQMAVSTVLAKVYWAQGHWIEADAQCQAALATSAKLKLSPAERFDLWWEIFNQAILRRDFATAEQILQQALAWRTTQTIPHERAVQLQEMLRLFAVAQERWTEAYALIQARQADALAMGNQGDYCDALCGLALVTLQMGLPTKALTFAEEAFALATQQGLQLDLPMAHIAMAFTLQAEGRTEEAYTHLAAVLDYALTRRGEMHALRYVLAGILGIACLKRSRLPRSLFVEAVALVAAQPQCGVIIRIDARRLAATEGIDLTAAEAQARQPVDWRQLAQLVQALRAG